jgi:hypothetical protein
MSASTCLLVIGEDLRADRHLDHERSSAPAPVRLLAHAVPAAAGLEMLRIAKVDQRVEARRRHSNTISPPLPPSPPSGPPNSTNFSRRNDTLPSPPGRKHEDLGLVEKLHGGGRFKEKGEPVARLPPFQFAKGEGRIGLIRRQSPFQA